MRLPSIFVDDGLVFKNESPGNLVLRSPEKGGFVISTGDYISFEGMTQSNLDVFYDLRKAYRLGKISQHLEMPKKETKRKKETRNGSTKNRTSRDSADRLLETDGEEGGAATEIEEKITETED